ncbi:uncharacterized protein PAE49_022621 isoform 1-T2 [Odontesthes bonariensis]|uniref:uncharacterized protein LOC142370378 n=1 Tax=Odontesthes bonariensis TaxID=219752 RepID=UPI003F5860C0
MGNCCCQSKSPCSSAEERSGLLEDESKVKCTGDGIVDGTCGPGGGNEMRRDTNEEAEDAQMKRSPEKEPNNSQGNGPLQRGKIQTATPSPHKASELKENSTRAQHKVMKGTSADSGQAERLQCTLKSSADSEVVAPSNPESQRENPASVQEKIPDGVPQQTEAACSENSSHAETNTTAEPITAHNVEEECSRDAINIIAKPSGELTPKNEVLSVPNTQLVAAAGLEASVFAVSQETDTKALSCAVTVNSDNSGSLACTEDGSEDIQGHDVSKSSSGLDPTGLGHSVEKRDSASSVSGPEATSAADAKERLKSEQEAKLDPESRSPACLKEVISSNKIKQDAVEETVFGVQGEDISKAKEEEEVEGTPAEAEAPQVEKDVETQEKIEEVEQLTGSTDLTANIRPATAEEDDEGSSEEDLYRGAEELSAPQNLKVEDRCSLAPAVDILSYSEREWRGNTTKSALIKKGYKELAQRFVRLRRVRGDNYCALRATLFQVLSQSARLPAWLQEDDVTMMPMQLEEHEELISQWRFPAECMQGDSTGGATQQLKGYLELLRNTWQAAVDCISPEERQQLCERVFQGGEEELGLLEALKLLMLGRAVELHSCMQGNGDVPLFCWLLFARDSSDCPRSFLSNHLRHVGLSAGLEQVEMFLLGYALHCTIQVYRLYMADTEEFVTYYPDDHKDEWESVCLVTEDDRHYNVPVVEAAEPQEGLTFL